MAREPLDAALAADLERLGHDAAAVAAGKWPTRNLTDRSLQFLRGELQMAGHALDQGAAERKHVVAMVCAAMSARAQVRSNEHPMWRAFLKTLSPEYRIPERHRIWSLIKELDEAISCKLRELLSDASQMWFLTSDGATSKGEGLLSIDCRNSHGDCYHLALINGEWRKQDAVWIKQQLKVADPARTQLALAGKHSVSLRKSYVPRATIAWIMSLAVNMSPNFFIKTLHAAYLGFGSCQESHERAHNAQKVILKRKRARAFVTGAQKHAVSVGKLRRLRKLRVIRRTRFNSRVQVLDSFLLNTPLMRRVIAAPAFAATMQVDNARKQKRVDEAMKAWSYDATYHRARRALIIGAPCAVPGPVDWKIACAENAQICASSLCVFAENVLTRRVGGADFFKAHAAWLHARNDIIKAVADHDFVDHKRKETEAVLQTRRNAMAEILDKRSEAYCTAAHKAAFVLDPRLQDYVNDPDADEELGFSFTQARQDAAYVLNSEYLPKFFSEPTQVRQAQSAVRDYLAHSGPFKNVTWPDKSASVADVVGFFETGQPSWFLRELGLHFAALAGSQGMSERTWATLSRQAQPIRARLIYPAKKRLLNIAANWKLLYPDLAPMPPERKRRRHDFEIPTLASRRAGPSEPAAEGPQRCDESSSSTSSSSSSSSSSSNVREIPDQNEDEDQGFPGDSLVDDLEGSDAPEEAVAASALRALGLEP
ncbi:GIP [Symbiodinium sp. CCMP2592]|nr:GIP [Symbiodinium sp. CCMP2592]